MDYMEIRLECLKAAVKLAVALPTARQGAEVIDMAREFEEYVSSAAITPPAVDPEAPVADLRTPAERRKARMSLPQKSVF